MTGKMSDQFCNVSRDNSCRLDAALVELTRKWASIKPLLKNEGCPLKLFYETSWWKAIWPVEPSVDKLLTDASKHFDLEDMNSLEIANCEAYSSLGTKQSQASDPTHQRAALFRLNSHMLHVNRKPQYSHKPYAEPIAIFQFS
ncbi:hypothetical protein I7I51_04731 [Histoplasma capsulatum]|uniref:Uncharacterized protein n=1 Tax=Ajellomyces capsulatus TaxID=5037 RepID=A0A8A1M2W1_AJECA|nr:hypothetical protein I7I51_04731 [Histoplasma capsulatum]